MWPTASPDTVMTIDEFADALRQDVLAEADADGQFREDLFFEKACAFLVEAGDLDTADRAPYWHPTRGIRVDGSGGDPRDSDGTLSLIALDYSAEPHIGRLIGREMDVIFQRMKRFITHALKEGWRNALEETSPAFGLADLVSRRWSSVNKVRLILVSNRELSKRVEGRPEGTVEGKRVTYTVWDLQRLHRAGTSSEPEVMEIDLANDFGGAIDILPAQHIAGAHESYLAVIPGSVLSKIYDDWGPRLLEQNVRVFLQARNKVNRGIRDTLTHEPTMFFAYNNGITATAQEVDVQNDRGRLSLQRMTNFQIVNGGQTTASIHAAMRKGEDLSQIFVQMKLSVVDSHRATAVVPKISEYANSQNRVSASDFFANHPFHIRVENFSRRMYAPSPDGMFQESKWFYERARGQYADARAYKTTAQRRKFDIEYPRHQRFTKTDLAKFLNVWEGRPHEVSRGAQKNFAAFACRIGQAWKKTSIDFNEVWYREAIAKAILFKATERIVSAQPWYRGGYRANIVAYTIARISHHVKKINRAVDFQAIWRRQALDAEFRKTVEIVAKRMNQVLTNPTKEIRNVTEWAKKQDCWDRANTVPIQWPAELDAALISFEERQRIAHSARREQRQLNGMEAQIAVVNAGGHFWADALLWGRENGLLTPKEIGILNVAASIPRRMPTDRQSLAVLRALARLCSRGYQQELPQRTDEA